MICNNLYILLVGMSMTYNNVYVSVRSGRERRRKNDAGRRRRRGRGRGRGRSLRSKS